MTAETTKTCGCGRTHDAAGWAALPLVGHMDLDADGDARVELRNCVCRSTLAIDLPAPALDVDAVLWSMLGDELDASALPLPPRAVDVDALEREALTVAAAIERQIARDASTVRPQRGAS